MRDYEKELLRRDFKKLRENTERLEAKLEVLESLGEGDLVFIDNGKNSWDLSFIGYVERIVPNISIRFGIHKIGIPIIFQSERGKILIIETGLATFNTIGLGNDGTVYPNSDIYVTEEEIDRALRKYGTSFEDFLKSLSKQEE